MRFYDPTGAEYGIPTYPRRLAPEGLATRRQLRAQGLRPNGQDVAAQILWHGRRNPLTRLRPVRVAYLYRIDLAAPVRPMTPGRQRAVAAMLRARRTCPLCQVTHPYVIPTSLGCCPGCADAPAALAA
ncbi:RRQRL motif-containing zinc-binding protein [Streptomyces sp. NPDC014983]|uniref:RRQRL motif-containing zinc-binding protein n=1 Tax=Streptomyces sp. NPDC014983 TaxID=3364933 RepID=UPI003703002E